MKGTARTLALLALLAALGCAGPVAEPALVEGSTRCASCHAEHVAQWSGSPHAASARSPVLAAMLPEVEREWGEVARRQCEGCHAPGHSTDEGIGCVSCHAAVGNHAERDGMIAIDATLPFAGPLEDAVPNEAHGSRRGDFLASPSLCGTCHELTGPVLVDEPTLTEFRASPQAAEGRTCASCHLPAEPDGPLVDGGPVRARSSHRFVGFDPPWGASAEDAAAAAERTRALLASALELRVVGRDASVVIEVQNVGAGHAVPTGATFLRDLWVDLEVDGEIVASRVLSLGDQPMNVDRPVPLLTRATHVEHGSLAPLETRAVEVAIDPEGVVARLRGRAIRAEALEALGLGARASEVPTHEVASATPE